MSDKIFEWAPTPWSAEEEASNSIVLVDANSKTVCSIMADDDADEVTEREWAIANGILAAVNKRP